MLVLLLVAASLLPSPSRFLNIAFHGRSGAYVQIDVQTGARYESDAKACAAKVAPCSTFKIWNSAIGLQLGLVASPDAPFWKWDGVKRDVAPGWNQDQTLRSAFAVSCVPAYQALARQIGQARMQEWLDRLGYGDRDISSGVDVFWLPAPGRKTILLSAIEQAELTARLAKGDVPFSARTQAALKEIMKVQSTAKGTLYGKTGTGTDHGTRIGWFVGYVVSSGSAYAFACRLEGDGVMGTNARAAVESILAGQGLL